MTWFQNPPLGTPLDWGNSLNDETVLHLPMNEGHGDKVQDLSLNRNHGTLNNFSFPPTAVSGWNPGQTGIGLNFDGSGDHIDCGDAVTLRPNDFMTISALFKTNHDYAAAQGTIVGDYSRTAVFGCTLWVLSDNTIEAQNYNSIANRIHTHSTDTVNDGVWHHVAAVFNDAIDVDLYVDGEYQGPPTIQGAPTVLAHGTNLFVGRQGTPDERRFYGPIDQPRIMNKAWSAKEVKDYAINPWQVYLDE